MSKELPYFRFISQEWQNGDISIENYSVQGVFINICAHYWIKDCSIALALLKKRFRDAEAEIKVLLDAEIIKHDPESDLISISFLDEQYDMLSKKRKLRVEAGRKGGKHSSSKRQAMLKQSSSYKDKDKDKDKDKEDTPLPPTRGKFVPPTIEEVETYFREKAKEKNVKFNYKAKAEDFLNHYEANGWMIGKTKMKNWKAAVGTWMRKIIDDYKKTSVPYHK